MTVKKLSVTKINALVNELGLVEEYATELAAEISERKKALWPYVGQSFVTDEFECAVYEQQGRTLDKVKLMKKFGITEKQLKSCYKDNKKSTNVRIKRLGVKKSEQRAEAKESARKRLGGSNA